jgi:hypothetical protein
MPNHQPLIYNNQLLWNSKEECNTSPILNWTGAMSSELWTMKNPLTPTSLLNPLVELLHLQLSTHKSKTWKPFHFPHWVLRSFTKKSQ